MAINNSSLKGAFVPTTQIWDPRIESAQIEPELKEILIRMYQNLALIANVLNVKETGQYNNQYENVCSKFWFPNPALTSQNDRPVYRTVVNFGALPNNTTKQIPHNIDINAAFSFTNIYATATNPNTEFIPIPYVSAAGTDPVEIWIDPTYVNIKTITNYSAYTICYVVIEYTKM
jgi:hypothetical protein